MSEGHKGLASGPSICCDVPLSYDPTPKTFKKFTQNFALKPHIFSEFGYEMKIEIQINKYRHLFINSHDHSFTQGYINISVYIKYCI